MELDSQEQEKWNSLRQDSKGIYQQEDAAKAQTREVTAVETSRGSDSVPLRSLNTSWGSERWPGGPGDSSRGSHPSQL